jgi:hypothetical protein
MADFILFDQRGVGVAKPALECPEVNRVGSSWPDQ